MIYLLHGPDTVSSREYLLKLRSNYESYEIVDTKALLKNPENYLTSQSLFGEKRLLIVENYTPKEDEPLVPQSELDLVIWTDDLVTPPKWVEKNIPFKLPTDATIFKFVDSVFAGNQKQAFLLLETLTKENTPLELILGMLTRQLRLLTLGLADEWGKVSKSPFVLSKVREQVQKWPLKKVRQASLVLLKADSDNKNSRLKTPDILVQLILKLTSLV